MNVNHTVSFMLIYSGGAITFDHRLKGAEMSGDITVVSGGTLKQHRAISSTQLTEINSKSGTKSGGHVTFSQSRAACSRAPAPPASFDLFILLMDF